MKIKKSNSKQLTSIVVIVSIVLTGFLINGGKSAMEAAVIEATLDEANQIGTQIKIELENTLEKAEDDLSALADFIAEAERSEDDVIEYLHTQSLANDLEVLYYIDLEGNGTSIENNTHDFSENQSFLDVLEGDVHFTQPHESLVTGEIAFGVLAPVIQNGETTAVLYSEASMEGVFEALEVSTEGSGDLFLVDKDLNLIYSTSENHVGSGMIPEGDVAEMGPENVMSAQSDILNGQSGGFYYSYDDVSKAMMYYPLEMTGLTLAINLEVDFLNEALVQASRQFEMIVGSVYWMAVVLVVLISTANYRSNKALEKTAYYDSLTGLPNVEKLKKTMSMVLKKNDRKPYAMMLVDVENFKAINELYGFEVGDRALKAFKSFADTVSEPTLILARISGDKFAFFAGNHYLDDMESIAAAFMVHFDVVVPELVEHHGTFKCGRYHIEPGETDVEEILNKVTLAHKIAKETKGLVLCDYNESFKAKLIKESEIANKMKPALANGEYKVYLQPKFSVYGETLVGAEALVRWQEADGTMIFPNEFIPLFERNGFIVELDKYILDKVCMTISRWMSEGVGHLCVSVNCSRLNLDNPYFVEGVVAIANKYCVPHEYIEIELTESVTVESDDKIEKFFADLHRSGFKTSIDDFGAGYSSLGMLKNLSVDTLKMDRSFFVGAKIARRDDMLIDSIVKMSHSLGMFVVAEGIETQEQVELLKTMNCDAVQGYVYAKPMPISDFEAKYNGMMAKNSLSDKEEIPLIHNINDTKFASSVVPCGILIADLDEYFTIKEANQGYFDIVGFTREEVRDLHQNRGICILHPEDVDPITKYMQEKMQANQLGQLNFVLRASTKSRGYITMQMNGKISANENGQQRIYFSLTDISDHTNTSEELRKEKEFNALIALMAENMFFDYEANSDTMRFSKNFAHRLNIPEVVHNYRESELMKEVFQKSLDILHQDVLGDTLRDKPERELEIKLPDGNFVRYSCSFSHFLDKDRNKFRTIGKLTEIADHHIKTANHGTLSGNDVLSSFQQKTTGEQFIHELLGNIDDSTKCALLKIHINNVAKIRASFGRDYADESLEEIGRVLGGMFRSIDIIGKLGEDEFFVFIKDNKTTELVERKAGEICTALQKIHKKGDLSIEVSSHVGIALYPQHGLNFDTLYKKANKAMQQMKQDGRFGFFIFQEEPS